MFLFITLILPSSEQPSLWINSRLHLSLGKHLTCRAMLWCQLKRPQVVEEGVRCQFRQFHIDSIGVVQGTVKRHVNSGVSQSTFWKLTSKFQKQGSCSVSFCVSFSYRACPQGPARIPRGGPCPSRCQRSLSVLWLAPPLHQQQEEERLGWLRGPSVLQNFTRGGGPVF